MQPMLLLLYSHLNPRLLFVFILSLTCTCVIAHAAGTQNDHPVTLNGTTTLRAVFKAIKQQTGYAVMYSTAATSLNQDEKVNVNFKDTPLDDVLAYVLRGKELDWKYSDDVLVIHKKAAVVPEKKIEVDSTVMPALLTGKVTDANGAPLIGATVQVKGTNQGTTTDAEGNFALPKVGNGNTLVVSNVGYERREIAVNGRRILTQLNMDISKLDETVVLAYGTTTKRMLTGNVSTIKAKDIEKSPVNNPLLALQGRVPGIFIEQSSGLPGTGVTVRIQGQNSLQNGNDPLYVIDGVPYTSQSLPGLSFILGSSGASVGNGNPFSFINPADIESIDILKDADATAIYGSRAANGAILVTTKKGKAGRTKVDINMQQGSGKVTRHLPLLNLQQYLEMRHEAKRNDNTAISPADYDINGTWDSTRSTDWQKVLLGGTSHYTDAQASISGGNAATQFLIGAGYHRETTVFPGSLSDQKASIHFNINNISPNQRFRVQLTGSYLADNNRLITNDVTSLAYSLPPNAPALKTAEGELNWAPDASGNSTWYNPLAYLLQKYKNNTNNLVANAVLSYAITPSLDIRLSTGYTNMIMEETTTNPLVSYAPENRLFFPRRAGFSHGSIRSWIIEPQLNFKHNIGKGVLETLLGGSIQQKNSNLQSIAASGFNSDLVLEDILSAPFVTPANTIISLYRYSAIFARLNYTWEDKYILNFTARRDGSSRFGPENQFHTFGSIGAAWIFTNEPFFKNNLPFLSFGKLRGSYGSTGNDQIGDYQFLSLYYPQVQSNPYQGVSTLAPASLPNPYLQWEETRKLQLGLDVGFLKDRILLNANYYRNRSSNQLQNYSLPIITGFGGIIQNFDATIQNKGWEFSLSATNVQQKNVVWTSTINLTLQQNKLIAYKDLANSTFASSYIVGQPITIFQLYNFAGVDAATGLYQFMDKNGKLTSLPNRLTDRTQVINLAPVFYGGFQNSFQYRQFSLDLLFQFVRQKGRNFILGSKPGFFESDSYGSSSGNQPVFILDRWQNPGDNAATQKYSSIYNAAVSRPYNNAVSSIINVDDASYIRLKNVSLSWRLPVSWSKMAKINAARLYVQGQNLLTLTHYKGIDPENRSTGALPPLKVWTIGAQLTL